MFSPPARLERDRHLHGAADRPAVAHCRTAPPLADGIGCGAVGAARAAAAYQVERPGHAVGADVEPQQHGARLQPAKRGTRTFRDRKSVRWGKSVSRRLTLVGLLTPTQKKII